MPSPRPTDSQVTPGGKNLSPGDVLVLYTDGLSEARREGVLLGEDGLRELLGALDNRPQALVEGLRRSALAYAGGLRDDLQVWSIVRQR